MNIFTIDMSQILYSYLYAKLSVVFLKFKFSGDSYILSGNPGCMTIGKTSSTYKQSLLFT